eukprot:1150740-Pelagomonas_calceolata.AAC.2
MGAKTPALAQIWPIFWLWFGEAKVVKTGKPGNQCVWTQPEDLFSMLSRYACQGWGLGEQGALYSPPERMPCSAHLMDTYVCTFGGRIEAKVVPGGGVVEEFRGGVEEGGPSWDVGEHAQGYGVGLKLAGQGLPDSRVVGPMPWDPSGGANLLE